MTPIARRPLLAGLAGLLAIGVVAYEAPSWFRPRFRATPYDDLLTQLADRDNAIKLGNAVLASEPHFEARATADALRRAAGHAPLARLADSDATEGRLVEVQGWVLPASLARLAALAAHPG